MKSAASSAAANEGKVAVRQYLYSKTGIYTGTYVPVLAHYGGCMAVVWRLYGGSLPEAALCSARMLISSPCEQHEL